MLVEIRYNPASGRGKAARVAARFHAALEAAGHGVRLNAVRGPAADSDDGEGPPALLVLIGGDGTVKHSIRDAVALGAPVYHVPLGNENLFAREFAMGRDPSTLLRAIDAWRLDRMDIGVVSSAHAPARTDRFAIMLSIGPDASVIHRLETDGRCASGHLAYIAPIAEELGDTRLAPITAIADGRAVVEGATGLLVLANLRHYGFRLNPAPDADPRDGLLDLVFIPASGAGQLLAAGALARVGQLRRWPGLVTCRARSIELVALNAPVQVDGEALSIEGPWRVEAQAAALRVLGAT